MTLHPIDCDCSDCVGDSSWLRVTIFAAAFLVVIGLASFLWGLVILALRLF